MDRAPEAPDIALLAAEWQPRALLRAQLAIVDLKGLPNPGQVLSDLRILMKPERVLILTAMGTVAPADVKRQGFRALPRPIAIKSVVRLALQLCGAH